MMKFRQLEINFHQLLLLQQYLEFQTFAVKKIAKRVPVIIGTGSNCTSSAIELTKYAESIGVDGALVVTPYYNKATQ